MDLEFEVGKKVAQSTNYHQYEILRKGLFMGHIAIDKDVNIEDVKLIKLK